MGNKQLGRPPKVSRFMSVDEVAEFFDITPATVREWCRVGRLPAARPGRDWKILRENVHKLAQADYGSTTPED